MGKLIWIISIILIIVGFIIVKIYDLNLENPQDQKKFASNFFEFLFKIIKNIKEITGFITKQDWSINETKNETRK